MRHHAGTVVKALVRSIAGIRQLAAPKMKMLTSDSPGFIMRWRRTLCFLGQEQLEPTPGQCESIMRLYEGLYSLATRLGNRSVAPNSASLTRHWLKKSLELSGWRRPLLLRRLMGLRLYTFLKKCALSPRLRDFAIRLRHGFRGVPFQIGDRTIRLDESLRRWHVGGESQVQEVLLANLKAGDCMVDVGQTLDYTASWPE